MYGSCRTGTSLNDADVNLELMYPADDDSINHATALISAADILEKYCWCKFESPGFGEMDFKFQHMVTQ